MHQRSWKTLIAGGAALAAGLTLSAFGAPTHAEGVAGITSEARAQDEVMNYAVNLPATASRYDFNAAVSRASEHGVVLAQYPEFNSFFVQSVKAAYAPDLGKSLVAAGISYDSIGPTRYKTVTGDEVRTEQPTKTDAEANAVNEAAAEHETGLSAESQLNASPPTRATPTPGACPPSARSKPRRSTCPARQSPSPSWTPASTPTTRT